MRLITRSIFSSSSVAVAALYLNAARTLHHHLAHTPHGLLIELVLCHGVQQVGRVEYASAAFGYFGIAQASYLVDKLALAASRIHYVGMRVAP